MSITCSWEFQIRWKLFWVKLYIYDNFMQVFICLFDRLISQISNVKSAKGFQTRNIFFFSFFLLWLIRRNNKQNLKTKEKWKFYDNQAMLLCMNMKKANKRGIKISIWDHDYWLIRFRCDYCLLIFFGWSYATKL